MNALISEYGLAHWKAVIAALLMPPVPFLLLAALGAWLLWGRRTIGWLMMGLSLAGLWLGACAGVGQTLTALLLGPPPALGFTQIESLAQTSRGRRDMTIVVLGGGREVFAPEYGVASLAPPSLERLRYGLWLGRQTGLPVGFSGGTGWAQADGLSEAQIASRIAAEEFGRPLRWIEEQSRDTRENAARTVALLDRAGISEIVLVTHVWHMPRARRAFEQAGAGRLRVVPAPIGLASRIDRQALLWLPSAEGFAEVRHALRERIGLWAGA